MYYVAAIIIVDLLIDVIAAIFIIMVYRNHRPARDQDDTDIISLSDRIKSRRDAM